MSESPSLVTPETLKGFQDLLPEDAIPRERIVAIIKGIYEKYGYVPIDTPILENLATLVGAGSEETTKQLFRLKSPENEPIAMRFDLTVPFARLIAQYPDRVKLPFRRYHIGPVFRADDPRPGRFRQFTQFDIDAAGSESVAVDAEIVAAMCEVMQAIGLSKSGVHGPEYRVLINNRKLVDALLEGCGITDETTVKGVLRVVDKLDKVGLDNVRLELGVQGRVDESGDKIRGVGLEVSVIDRIVAFISGGKPTRRETLANLQGQLPDSPTSQVALAEMTEMADVLDAMGVGEGEAIFDPSLARGLDYYTGPVFEAILTIAKVGSVMGGGRYDNLVRRFMDAKVPATGVSIGLDRLIAGLRLANRLEPITTTVHVMIVAMAGMPKAELLKVATELRSAGLSTFVYFGSGKSSFSAQMGLANFQGIPVAVILGEDELKAGKITVKNLKLGKEKRADIKDREAYRQAGKAGQVTIDRTDLVSQVRAFLETKATDAGA